MAAFWDIVGKAANLFQLFGGLDAITLVTVATSFLRFHEINKECRKLEERMQMLRLLLLSPAGSWIMMQHQDQQQQNWELRHLVTNALKDAHGLVESYKESTLFARVRRGRSMATRSRALRSSIDSYCGIILSVNAFLLAVQTNPPPPSLLRAEVNDVGVPPSAGDSIDAQAPMAAPDATHIIDIEPARQVDQHPLRLADSCYVV